MGSFSIWHWLVVLAVVLLLFGGGGKISKIMGDMAKGVKSFKKNMKEEDGEASGDGDPEGVEQVGTFTAFNDVLHKLADIKVERDQVVDGLDLTTFEFAAHFFIALTTGNGLSPDFGGQSGLGRSRCVPLLAPLKEARF
mgnify:CR=1 FL=1